MDVHRFLEADGGWVGRDRHWWLVEGALVETGRGTTTDIGADKVDLGGFFAWTNFSNLDAEDYF